ncbi:MAG: TIGR03089 family protein, partial [Actinomycetes bacterium]
AHNAMPDARRARPLPQPVRNVASVIPAAAPFVTFYDAPTSERAELSGTTFDNWIAKTANLLRDEYSIEPGDRVGVNLPIHWLTSVWIGAIWQVGATVVAGPNLAPGNPDNLDLAVIGPTGVPESAHPAFDTVACSLRPLGLPFTQQLPVGIADYSSEVRIHGDHFGPPEAMLPGQAALILDDRCWTPAEASADAAGLCDRWGMTKGGRLLLADRGDTELPAAIWLALLSVPRAAHGSLVIVRNADPDTLDAIAKQEHVSAVVTNRS